MKVYELIRELAQYEPTFEVDFFATSNDGASVSLDLDIEIPTCMNGPHVLQINLKEGA